MSAKKTGKSKVVKKPGGFPVRIVVTVVVIVVIVAAAFALFNMGKKKNTKALFQDGKKLYAQEKYEEAAKKLFEYTKTDKTNKEAWLLLIKSLLQLDRPDDLYFVLEKAQKQFPGDKTIEMEMARFYIKTGQNEKAKEQLNKIWEKSQDNPMVKLLSGMIYLDEQNGDKAYDEFKEILSFEPETSEDNKKAVILASGYLIEIIGNLGKTGSEPLAIISKAEKVLPEEQKSRAYVALGVYFYKKGEPDSALKRFQIALKKAPEKESWANLAIAKIYDDKGDRENALKYYKQYMEIYGKPGKKYTKEEAARISIYKGMDLNNIDIKKVREKIEELER